MICDPSSIHEFCSQVQVYKFVVEDVIKNVKEDFLNEGVEPEVLDQLQEVSYDRRNNIIVQQVQYMYMYNVHTCTCTCACTGLSGPTMNFCV